MSQSLLPPEGSTDPGNLFVFLKSFSASCCSPAVGSFCLSGPDPTCFPDTLKAHYSSSEPAPAAGSCLFIYYDPDQQNPGKGPAGMTAMLRL